MIENIRNSYTVSGIINFKSRRKFLYSDLHSGEKQEKVSAWQIQVFISGV